MGILHRSGSLKSLCSLTRHGLRKRSPFCRLSSDGGLHPGSKSPRVDLVQNAQEVLDRSIRTCLQESDPHTMVDLFEKALQSRTPPLVRTIDVAMDVFSRARAEDRVGLIWVHRALMEFNLLTERVLKSELALCNKFLLKDTMLQLCREIPNEMWTPDMCHYIAARFEFLYGESERWVMPVLQFFAAHNVPLRSETVEKILRWTSSSHLKSATLEVQCYLLDICLRRSNSPLAILEIFSSCPQALNRRQGFLFEVCILCIDDRGGYIRHEKKREVFELISTLDCWDTMCTRLIERYENDVQKLIWFLNTHAKEALKTSITTWKSILGALKRTTTVREEKVAIFSDLINSSPAFLDYAFEASIGISSTQEKEEGSVHSAGNPKVEKSKEENGESLPQIFKREDTSQASMGREISLTHSEQLSSSGLSESSNPNIPKLEPPGKSGAQEGLDKLPDEIFPPKQQSSSLDSPAPVNCWNSVHPGRVPVRKKPIAQSQRPEIPIGSRESNLTPRTDNQSFESGRAVFDRLRPALPVNLPPIIPYLMNHIRPRELQQVLEKFERDINEIPELAQSRRSRETELTTRLQEAFEAQVTLSNMHVRRARGARPNVDRTPKGISENWSSFGDSTRR